MALARAAAQLRSAVLGSIRVPASPLVAARELGAPLSLQFARCFAEGTYLDKGQVTDRILELVKNFEKVEPSKVSTISRPGDRVRGWRAGSLCLHSWSPK